ncbi:unnamed protein product [Ilex paraguariensis]|uniref:AP180 N-terminal homology (ANTH) domain-containing protein n=1 Tax=Ilex paraguariensis TaxID=185542 RepID=A0ABC8UTA2_9AQUA
MQRHDAVRALEIYRKAGDQAVRLSEFFEICRDCLVSKNSSSSNLFDFASSASASSPSSNQEIFQKTPTSNILVNKQPASLRRLCGERNILELTGEDHRRMRAALVSFLKPEVLRQYVGKMDEEVRMHLQMHWHDKQQVKVCQLLPLVRKKIL